jgi:hypothetical protein
MVWIIPRDEESIMIRQLIALMTNIETNKTIFGPQGNLIEDESPFNIYENEYFSDEYRFVKGYIQYTGVPLSCTTIDDYMASMNKYMRGDTAIDINYCYPTSHYTVARVSNNDKYNRLITSANLKLKHIIKKYNFIWSNSLYNSNKLYELKPGEFPETYELMRSLSTIIYDDAGIFTKSSEGQPLIPGKSYNQINMPELWQLKGSNKIIGIPIKLSYKFSTRENIRAKFNHLIPDSKKFAINRSFFKYKYVNYTPQTFDIVETKKLEELNIVALDNGESIITKVKNKLSKYELVKLNINETNKKTVNLNIALKYLSCHVCFTPVYKKFYYILASKQPEDPQPHVPICATCVHNTESKIFGKINIGISLSPLNAYDVMSFVPKPIHISYDHYEKYKETLEELLDQTIIVSDENAMSIIYENEKNILVTGINNSLLLNCPITDKNVFIIELIP